MKYLLIISLLVMSIVGCAGELAYTSPESAHISTGWVEVCDDYGCREVWAKHYYFGGEIIYWDEHFGCWIAPHAYWAGGIWRRGYVAGYHEYWHRGWYRTPAYHGYHEGFHGGYHGGHR